ncbi:response regulator [Rhodobacteraceae bacterium NNCM2]|nr:response regulator [Coraliihabitans acroporae]
MADKYKVLVVDDNAINQFVLAEMLVTYDIEVAVASTGREAIALATENDFDLVFMDIWMDDMTGIDAALEITGQATGRKPKIVAISADDTDENWERCRENGIEDFLTKPIGINSLRAILEAHLPGVRRMPD